ncbi:MAG: prepilin peptidase [Candidatus Micrarchaeota archaeon]|nr:prepilin peptidase [Candidatus Micrarchaeota archaeon]MDE1804925.1 prepilin peptidase [Candidatus Micrarchaeota archaeon]
MIGALIGSASNGPLYSARLIALIAMVIIYAIYDVFNKRDIPDAFAYVSVFIGVIFTLVLGLHTIEFSALVAIVVGALSYVLYRVGQLGLGDGFEFVAISLLIPIQPSPLLFGGQQFGMPFILSVFVATGFTAIVFVPLYYILKMNSKSRKEARSLIGSREAAKAAILIVAYASLLLFVTYLFGFNPVAAAIISLIAVFSALMALFEKGIMRQMIALIYPRELEDGDIIAEDMMAVRDIAYFRKISPGFGRLVTPGIITKIARVRRRIPVYKHAVPLAVPTLVGVGAALLFGNLLLYLV